MSTFWIVHGVAAALALLAALWELQTEKIPNAICVVGLLAGAVFVAWDGAFMAHARGFFLAFLPALIAYRKGWLGGGATKWFAVAGWMVGLRGTLIMWPLVLSAVVVVFVQQRIRKKPTLIPFAPVVFVGVLFATALERRF